MCNMLGVGVARVLEERERNDGAGGDCEALLSEVERWVAIGDGEFLILSSRGSDRFELEIIIPASARVWRIASMLTFLPSCLRNSI
jgi:hypothetical protein